MKNLLLISSVLLALTLSACDGSVPAPSSAPEVRADPNAAAPAQGSTVGQVSPARVSDSSAAEAVDASAAQALSLASGDPGPVDSPAVQAARHAFALLKGVSDAEVNVVSVENVQWPDSSLGCPQPGQTYLPVITPGYRVILSVGDEQADYRTTSGDNPLVVKCGGDPKVVKGLEPVSSEIPAVVAARHAFAVAKGVSDEEVNVVGVEEVLWPDSSLGCPQPGQSYLPVVTPGYRVILAVADEQAEYHTDDTASPQVVRCDGPIFNKGAPATR